MEKIISLNKARKGLITFLSKYNKIHEGLYFVLLAIIDSISLLLNDRKIEDLHNQINEFGNILLKLFC